MNVKISKVKRDREVTFGSVRSQGFFVCNLTLRLSLKMLAGAEVCRECSNILVQSKLVLYLTPIY